MNFVQLAMSPGLGAGEVFAMRRAPAAAAPIPVSTMTPTGTAAISVGQPAAQRSTAIPTREHQSGGQPNPDCPTHGRALERSPPSHAPPALA